MYSFALLLTLVSLTLQSPLERDATSACSGQQYNNIPGFPAQNSACYPTNYYRTSDLGTTSPSDAQSRCEQQCTADNQCGSVVAQVNKAADQDNFYPSGTCFFFAQGQAVAPRRCADKAYLLEGYRKDDTNTCFSSSSLSASQYCSSYLGIPVSTVSVTATQTQTPATTTITTTYTASSTSTSTTTTTTVPTLVITTTATALTTVKTNTATVTVTTTTSSVQTQTSTVTETSSATATTTTDVSTTIIGVTSSTAVSPVSKRATGSIKPPACVTSSAPATRISAACSCLSITASVTTTTTTTTTTEPAMTVIATTTTTVVVPTTTAVTMTATAITSTSTVTQTNSVTATSVTSATVTSYMTVTTQVTTTVTVTTTTTTTESAVATQTVNCGIQCSEPTITFAKGNGVTAYQRLDQTCGKFDGNYNSGSGGIKSNPTFNGGGPDCTAIEACGNAATSQTTGNNSFRLWYGSYGGFTGWHCDIGQKTYQASQISYSNDQAVQVMVRSVTKSASR